VLRRLPPLGSACDAFRTNGAPPPHCDSTGRRKRAVRCAASRRGCATTKRSRKRRWRVRGDDCPIRARPRRRQRVPPPQRQRPVCWRARRAKRRLRGPPFRRPASLCLSDPCCALLLYNSSVLLPPPRLHSQGGPAPTAAVPTAMAITLMSAARGASCRRQRRCPADYTQAQTADAPWISHACRSATWQCLLHIVLCCTLCSSEYNESLVKNFCAAPTGTLSADYGCVRMCRSSGGAEKEAT